MNLTQQVLAACISIATDQNHGWMEGIKVLNHLHNNGIDVSFRSVCSILSKNQSWWRQGLPKKKKNGWLLRELKEEIWQEKSDPEDEIKDLRYQLREARKDRDAVQVQFEAVVKQRESYKLEMDTIRITWREFQNALHPRR